MGNTVPHMGRTNTGLGENNPSHSVPLPSGLVIDNDLAVLAQNAYRLGLFVRAEEAVEAGRIHENYLQILEDWQNSLCEAADMFEFSYSEPDLYTISATLNSGREPDEWWELVTVSVLQAGYLVEQYQQVRQSGLTDPEAIWAYLSLKTHPARPPYKQTFFSQETLRCPWPRPAGISALQGGEDVNREKAREGAHSKLSPYIPLGPGERIVTVLWP